MTATPGFIEKPSPYSVGETLDRLVAVLQSKGMRIFARIDQAGEAKGAGLEMPPMELLIFGNPKSGTPVMLAVPEAGIELPLKALAWQDRDGGVHLGYTDPAYFQARFGLPAELIRPLAAANALMDAVTGTAG